MTAAVCALFGISILVFWGLRQKPSTAMLVFGVALIVIGVVLVFAAFVVYNRLRRTLILDASAITLIRGRGRRTLKWSEIERVSLRGPRLVLVTKPGSGHSAAIINPGGHSGQTFGALVDAIRLRLDADRGYSDLA